MLRDLTISSLVSNIHYFIIDFIEETKWDFTKTINLG